MGGVASVCGNVTTALVLLVSDVTRRRSAIRMPKLRWCTKIFVFYNSCLLLYLVASLMGCLVPVHWGVGSPGADNIKLLGWCGRLRQRQWQEHSKVGTGPMDHESLHPQIQMYCWNCDQPLLAGMLWCTEMSRVYLYAWICTCMYVISLSPFLGLLPII